MIEKFQMKKIISLFVIPFALLFGSCVTPIGMTSSSTPIHGKKIVKNLGRAEGNSGTFSVLSLFSIGRPDIDKAIEEAVKSKGGDGLINVRMYEKTYFFLVVTYTEVIVSGDVVKFEEEQ